MGAGSNLICTVKAVRHRLIWQFRDTIGLGLTGRKDEKMKRLLFVNCISVILIVVLHSTSMPQNQLDRGGEWLSWSPAERNVFINGFIAGYTNGSYKACLAANDLFEVGQSHRLNEQPSMRCSAHLETYSKYYYRGSPDFSSYTTVITEFYTKYPEHRNIPFVYILSFLNDQQYKTADQLHLMALQGELRTNF